MTLLAQIGEIQAVEKLTTRLTDAGILGIAIGLIMIAILGGLSLLMQQRNFGKQAAAATDATQKLTELFAGLLGSISDRLHDAQNTKATLTTVLDNQETILTGQSDQGKLLMALPELVGLVNEALTMLHETVNGFKAAAIETSQQTAAGFDTVGKRFDTVDMQNGKILAELVKLNATIQAWIDRQEIGSASQRKEQRSLNDELLLTLKRIQEAVERGTQETLPVPPDDKQDAK